LIIILRRRDRWQRNDNQESYHIDFSSFGFAMYLNLCHLEQMYMSRRNIGGKFRSLTVKLVCIGANFWQVPVMYVFLNYSKNACPPCGIIVFRKNQHPPSPSYLLTEILICQTRNETLKIFHFSTCISSA